MIYLNPKQYNNILIINKFKSSYYHLCFNNSYIHYININKSTIILVFFTIEVLYTKEFSR